MEMKWKELLEQSRSNYLSIVQSLSKMQKELEKIMISTAENNFSYQKEFSGLLNQWVDLGNIIRDDMQKVLESNMGNTLSSLPFGIPFREDLEKLYGSIQDNFKKYFENLKGFDFLKK